MPERRLFRGERRPAYSYRPSTPSSSGFDLPSPTLVGIPVDETGYQALFREYGVYLVDAIVSDVASPPDGLEAALGRP